MILTQVALVALLFTMFFAGVVMVGQGNLIEARKLGLAKAERMAKLLMKAKIGGLLSFLTFVGVCLVVSPLMTVLSVTLSFGVCLLVFAKRMLAGDWEQVLLRSGIPTMLVACTVLQTGNGPLQLPLEMLVDTVIIVLCCWFIAIESSHATRHTSNHA